MFLVVSSFQKKKNENQTLKNSKQMNSLLPKFSSVISHSKNSNWLPANDRVEYWIANNGSKSCLELCRDIFMKCLSFQLQI